MDVHPPHEPIHSWKDFLLHLLTITIGLFIALSLESCTERVHHKHMVHEAEQNLAQEIEQNRTELSNMQSALEKEQQNLQEASRILQTRERGKRVQQASMTLNYTLAGLKSAAWQTASTTGTLAYMPYGDVQKYAEVYDLQSQFMRMQDTAIDQQLALISQVMVTGNPTDLTPADAAKARQQLAGVQSHLVALQQIGKGLDQEYANALKR